MKTKIFRHPTENGQWRTALSPEGRVMPTGAPTLRSGQAAQSGGIPSFRRFLATLGMTALLLFPALLQATPPHAASTHTWTLGWLTWSDRIVAEPANCEKTDALNTKRYNKAEYRVSDGRYYYSWTCVADNAEAFCPSAQGWRVPSTDDFKALSGESVRKDLLALWGPGGCFFLCINIVIY